MKAGPLRSDVHPSFRFWVELDGLIVGGFSEVTGLSMETEMEEYAEGGVNGFIHRLPKRVRYQPLSMKRGLTQSDVLWRWYSNTRNGKIERKSGSVILCDYNMTEVCRWNFFDSYPSKWVGPNLSSTSNEVAVETLEVVHNGIDVIFASG